MIIFAQQFNICSLNTPLATLTDGYVGLILLQQLKNRRQLTLVTKRLRPLVPTSIERCHDFF